MSDDNKAGGTSSAINTTGRDVVLMADGSARGIGLGPPPESAGLSPCPFCGGHARPSSRNGLTFFIECQTSYCAIVGPERCAVDAASAWNRRAALTINPDDPKQIECVARALWEDQIPDEDWKDTGWLLATSLCGFDGDMRYLNFWGQARAALKALSDAREKAGE